jgi:hypothetical protein
VIKDALGTNADTSIDDENEDEKDEGEEYRDDASVHVTCMAFSNPRLP